MTNYLTNYRQPCYSLILLNEDGTTLYDISNELVHIELAFDDDVKSHTASFTINNNTGAYDLFGGGSKSNYLSINRLFQFQKGLVVSGTPVLEPAFVGRIISTKSGYSQSKGQVIDVTAGDLFINSIKHLFTSTQFSNCQINEIITNLVEHYGDPALQLFGTNLATLNKIVPLVTFPVMGLLDCLSDLVDIPIYQIWVNYSGQLETFPKLGTGASGYAGQVGYPDALSAPTPFFTFTDDSIISQIDDEMTQMSYTNCVKVSGQSLSDETTLGPPQILAAWPSTATDDDPSIKNFVSAGEYIAPTVIDFSSGTGNNNRISATNVFLKVFDPVFQQGGRGLPGLDYMYIATQPGLLNDFGNPIDALMQTANTAVVNPSGGSPIPASAAPGWPVRQVSYQQYPTSYQTLVSIKSSGVLEGAVMLVYPGLPSTVPNVPSPFPTPSSLQSVTVSCVAKGDGGGFNFALQVWGQPIIIEPGVLTAIADYNPQSITENLSDAFGDHLTYQGSKIPWALGTTIEVSVNPSGMPNTVLTSNSIPVAVTTPPTPQTIAVSNSTGLLIPPGTPAGTNTVNLIAIDADDSTAFHTTLSSLSSAGSYSISVASSTGYLQGNTVTLGSGSTQENNSIISVAGTTVNLLNPTVFAHANGEDVYAPTTREYAIVTGVSGTAVTLSTNLNFAHASGVGVTGLTAVLSGDQIYQSLYCHADWEAGQVLFDDTVYKNFSPDAYYTPPTGSGSDIVTNSYSWNLALLTSPAPLAVYQTLREVPYNSGPLTYVFTGLTPGLGYKLRLHFADPTSNVVAGTGSGAQRQFGINVNGVWIETAWDIFEQTGQTGNSNGSPALYGVIKEIDGATADASGSIFLVLQNGPSASYSSSGLTGIGSPCISGIEVVPPEGSGLYPYTINCGGPAVGPSPHTTLSGSYSAGVSSIVVASSTGMSVNGQIQIGDNTPTTTAEVSTILNISGTTITLTSPTGFAHASGANIWVTPIVQATYGYSDVQQQMGLVSHEINDPLISLYSDAKARGEYEVNKSSWARYRTTLTTASVPTIKPGHCIKWLNSRIGSTGTYFWGYVQAIKREMSRESADSCIDIDTYSVYVLYTQAA